MYRSASAIRQGVKANTDAKVLKAKLALSWMAPCMILAVGSCSVAETPDGSPLGSNLLYLDPPDLPFGRLSACGHRALQTLRQPPPQRGHV